MSSPSHSQCHQPPPFDNRPHAAAVLAEFIARLQDQQGKDSPLSMLLVGEGENLIPKLAIFPRDALKSELWNLLKSIGTRFAQSKRLADLASPRADGDDFTQKGMIALFKELDDGKYVLSPRAFFIRASINEGKDEARSRKVRSKNKPLDTAAKVAVASPSPEDMAAAREELDTVRTGLLENPEVAIVAGLRAIGCSPDEISKITRTAERTWRDRLAKFRGKSKRNGPS